MKNVIENDVKIYVADFETSVTSEEENEVFVYATGLMNVEEDKLIYHKNIEDFTNYIFNLPTTESIIYFHNLSFDITFLLNYLVNEHGFTQNLGKYYLDSEGNKRKVFRKKSEEIINGSFDVIYANGSFYKVDLFLEQVHYKTKTGRTSKKTIQRKITFLDTYKIASFSLKKIAKDFLGVKMSKDGIDHKVIREKGYTLNHDEYTYLYEDVYYLKEFVKLIRIDGIQVNDDYKVHLDKMTIASQSLSVYKDFLYQDFLNHKNIKAFKSLQGFDIEKLNATKLFNEVFPQVNLKCDTFLRDSYYGGLTFKNPYLANQPREDLYGLVYDVNSLYPSVMMSALLPYGQPVYFKGNYIDDFKEKEDFPLYVQRIRVQSFDLKEGFIPNVQIRKNVRFKGSEYRENNIYIDEKGREKRATVEFTFTNVQLERFLKSYRVLGIEYLDGYALRGSNNLFDTYIDTFRKMKEEGQGAIRNTAKLFLNSLYGKFGTNPAKEERILNFDDGIFSTSIEDENGELLNYMDKSVYMAMASFITSYAREVLLNAVEKVHNRFLYADTDSIHILGNEIPDIPIHNKKFGFWKLECEFSKAKYIGAKRYAEEVNGKWEVKCCGLNKEIMEKITIDVFECFEGKTKDIEKLFVNEEDDEDIFYYIDKECTTRAKGVVRSKKKKYIKGGIIIKEQPYMIKDTYLY